MTETKGKVVGMKITLVEEKSLSREQLLHYAWTSGDENPIHYDEDAAKKRGLPKLIVHGMYLYNLSYKAVDDYLRHKALPYRIAEMAAKFAGMTFVDVKFSIEMDPPDPWEGPELKVRVFLIKKEGAQLNCSFQMTLERLEPLAKA